MITSANNTQVKNIIQLNQKAKARREQGLFVAEGRKMFGEAPKDWISRVYVTESLTAEESLMKQVMELPEEKREIVADNVFRQMGGFRFHTGSSLLPLLIYFHYWSLRFIIRYPAKNTEKNNMLLILRKPRNWRKVQMKQKRDFCLI